MTRAPFFPWPWRRGPAGGTEIAVDHLQAAEAALAAWASEQFASGPDLAVNAAAAGLSLDGAADDGPALNALIATLSAAIPAGSQREAVIDFPAGSALALGTPVVRLPFVSLRGNGSHIKVLPALNGGPVFTNPTNVGFARSDVTRFTIDKGGLEGTLFDCHSMQHSKIEIARMLGGTQLCTNLLMSCDATVGVGGELKSNSVLNKIEILDSGTCGYAGVFRGQAATGVPGGTGPAVVTLNTFPRFSARNVYKGGLDFVEWADSNYFSGMTDIAPLGEESFSLRLNGSATPEANVGVYANGFAHLTAECYGTAKKRRGVVLNFSYGTVIDRFFPEPLGDEGAAIDNKHGQSYWIRDLAPQVGDTQIRTISTPDELFELPGATPNTPPAGFGKLYLKGKQLVFLDSAGTVHVVSTTP